MKIDMKYDATSSFRSGLMTLTLLDATTIALSSFLNSLASYIDLPDKETAQRLAFVNSEAIYSAEHSMTDAKNANQSPLSLELFNSSSLGSEKSKVECGVCRCRACSERASEREEYESSPFDNVRETQETTNNGRRAGGRGETKPVYDMYDMYVEKRKRTTN